jgi:beta-fructofuranosidase
MTTFYKPSDAQAGDFIPLYWKGEYHIFYLKDYRDVAGHGEGTPWFHISTRDFVTFKEWGEAIPRGKIGQQDLWIFTGSALHAEGKFHIYYTGHNHHLREALDAPSECIMHAVSDDGMKTWQKDEGFKLFAPPQYETHDWRDPYVFWNGQAKEYWMLLAARKTQGPLRLRGCTALAVSKDLSDWQVREPFYQPDQWFTHECPDLFPIGKWWYLVFSEFSEHSATRYRMSRNLQGPWLAPANDQFDARAFYAAKTAGNDRERFVFGWLPTRTDQKDDQPWNWGGNLVVHKVTQEPGGSLSVRMPASVGKAFGRGVAMSPKPILGQWTVGKGRFAADATGRFSALGLAAMPDECLIRAKVTFDDKAASAGLLLRCDATMDNYYQVRLEPANHRLVIDRWPRGADQAFMLERPLAITPGKSVTLTALAEGSCLVVYANDKIALSCRMYDHKKGAVGIFVAEGKVNFDSVSMKSK